MVAACPAVRLCAVGPTLKVPRMGHVHPIKPRERLVVFPLRRKRTEGWSAALPAITVPAATPRRAGQPGPVRSAGQRRGPAPPHPSDKSQVFTLAPGVSAEEHPDALATRATRVPGRSGRLSDADSRAPGDTSAASASGHKKTGQAPPSRNGKLARSAPRADPAREQSPGRRTTAVR
jgi:hypothetical protein